MKGLCKKAGIKSFGFHALRRYVASVLADTHKLSSKRIQRILRHNSIHTTELYIQNLNDDMRDDLNLLCQPKVPEGVPEEAKEMVESW
jgi:integrase